MHLAAYLCGCGERQQLLYVDPTVEEDASAEVAGNRFDIHTLYGAKTHPP